MARGKKTGGRKKGTANKITADVRTMVLSALNDVGGQNYFKTQAIDNPVAFMSLVGRTIPKDVQVTGELTLRQLLEGASGKTG